MGFPGGSEVKNLPTNTGDMGSVPGLGRSPGEGNGNPFRYSCLENPTEEPGGTVHATEQACSHRCIYYVCYKICYKYILYIM